MNIIERGRAILDFALSKLGKPFSHIGRDDLGYDCAGLALSALKSIDYYEEDMDLRAYGRSPEGKKISRILNQYFDQIIFEDLRDGDILLFTYVKNPQHIAIYEDFEGTPYMVHAYGDPSINRVIRNRIDDAWQKRFVLGYRIKE